MREAERTLLVEDADRCCCLIETALHFYRSTAPFLAGSTALSLLRVSLRTPLPASPTAASLCHA